MLPKNALSRGPCVWPMAAIAAIRQFGPESHEETEHRYEAKSSDDADQVDGRDSTEARDGQDQLRRSDRGGV